MDSDMAFKFELSNTQLSRAFTPIDVILFLSRCKNFRFVFLFGAWEMSIASLSFNRLLSRQMRWLGGLPSRYSAIVTAPDELILLLLRLIPLTSDCSIIKSISGVLPRSQWVKEIWLMLLCNFNDLERQRADSIQCPNYKGLCCWKWPAYLNYWLFRYERLQLMQRGSPSSFLHSQ